MAEDEFESHEIWSEAFESQDDLRTRLFSNGTFPLTLSQEHHMEQWSRAYVNQANSKKVRSLRRGAVRQAVSQQLKTECGVFTVLVIVYYVAWIFVLWRQLRRGE